jgi:hypothetical protein
MIHNKHLILVILLLAGITAQAQSTVLHETRHWTSLENIDLYSGQILPDTFLITLDSTSLILNGGGSEKNFQIENIQGTWSDISQAGQMTFDLVIKGFTGKGALQKEAGVLSLLIDFSARKDWMKRKYIIND